MLDPIQFEIEYTDTFGGEANYSWVRRKTLTLPRHIPNRTVIRLAKAEMGLTGWRCRKEDMGETIALYPAGACQVLFITPVY